MEKTRVLFVSQEITPFLPETEMSLVGRYLPQGIQEAGKEIRTFMPRYGSVNERRNQLHEVIRLSGMNLIIDDTDHPLIIKVASIQAARMQVYFIDNEDYFHRKFELTDSNGKFFEDNDERFVFFNRGVLETVKKLRWTPDIVHCNGWFTGLIPLYINKSLRDDPLFSIAKIVYTVFDDNFVGNLHNDFIRKLKMDGIEDEDLKILNPSNYINVSKLAISQADGIIFGSQEINPELKAFIEESGKPVLPFQTQEKMVEAYSEFYDRILHKQ